MSHDPLPLAAASARLRGKPGRPRTRFPAPPTPEPIRTAAVGPALPPRLVTIQGAAAYCGGISASSIRDLIDAGELRRVRLPVPGGRELRRLLLDVRDLDTLIQRSKDPG